jgi:hypothetical protein
MASLSEVDKGHGFSREFVDELCALVVARYALARQIFAIRTANDRDRERPESLHKTQLPPEGNEENKE